MTVDPNEENEAKRLRAPKSGQLLRTEQAVMDAVTTLLREVGYRQISIDRVAALSSVARSTIYRRWGSVATLTIAAFDNALGPGLPSPDHGDVRTDLVHLYRRFAKILRTSIWGDILPSLIEASKTDHDFLGMLEQVDRDRRVNARDILQRAVARGELQHDADLDRIIDLLSGILYYRFLITGGRLSQRGLVEWSVDSALSQYLVSSVPRSDSIR